MDTNHKCNYVIEWRMLNKILLLHHSYCRCVPECEYFIIIVHIFLSRMHELEYSETQ